MIDFAFPFCCMSVLLTAMFMVFTLLCTALFLMRRQIVTGPLYELGAARARKMQMHKLRM